MKAMIMAILTFAAVAHAENKKHDVTYTVTDGYGQYEGKGDTKWKAAAVAWEKCVTTKVDAYEKRNGNPPDLDTLDLFIDACINL